MKILWEELEHLCPNPNCTCATKCTCSLGNAVKQFKEIECVICFLKGLNDYYSNICSLILLMDPLTFINKASALANQQETRPHQSLAESTTFTVNTNSSHDRNQHSQGRERRQMYWTQTTHAMYLLQKK